MSGAARAGICCVAGCPEPSAKIPLIVVWAWSGEPTHPPIRNGLPRAGVCSAHVAAGVVSLEDLLTPGLKRRIERGCRRAGKRPPAWSTARLEWTRADDPLYDVDRGGDRGVGPDGPGSRELL